MSNNNDSQTLPTEESNNNIDRLNDGISNQASSYNRKSYEKRASIQSSGQCSLSSGGSSSGNPDDGESRLLSSNADYDRIRNTTLMFFLDRLVIASKDGKEARTLHDLSCLFGTKDFTKEMRQIVGASRNGLKKFLESYPSLFTIDGDKVYLTQLQQDAESNYTRDYNKEAVEYFTHKLQQFGTSLVPIRNLFGYRSQASQEVRHISGKNTKEFRQFLTAHGDVFEILADEHVVLKTTLQELESRGELLSSSLQPSWQPPTGEEAVSMDPYLNRQFAHMVEECMEKLENDGSAIRERVEGGPQSSEATNTDENQLNGTKSKQFTIQFLHDKIIQECNNQLFLKMVRTIDDLRVFLRMHPKIFKRISSENGDKEYVSLLSDEERRELENNQSYLLARQHSSTLKRSETTESNLSNQECPSSLPLNNNNRFNNNQADPKSYSPSASTVASRNFASVANQVPNGKAPKFIPNEDSCNQIISAKSNQPNSSLRATAPPFVPSSIRMASAGGGTGATRTFQRSFSNLNPSVRDGHFPSDQPLARDHPRLVDQNQSIRNYLIKASTGNTSGSVYAPSKRSNGAQHLPVQHRPALDVSSARPPALSRQTYNGNNTKVTTTSSDDLRTRTVNIVREASNIVSRIMTSTDAVALDCKGYNLGFNGFITLIQFGFIPRSQPAKTNIGTTTISLKQQLSLENRENSATENAKPEVCVFDLITNPELAYCLKPLLESEQIVKIVHDVRNKSNALYTQFGIILNNVFDTQVANLVIQQQETGKPAYKSRFISMSKLCEVYGNESLLKYRKVVKAKHAGSGAQLSSTTSASSSKAKDVNYWRTRPLTETMVYEATMDVYCLVGGIYQDLRSRIKPEYEPLFDQLNVEGVLARIKPDEIRSVRKERKIDLEVIDLKRKLYSDTTGSIVLSNREIRLLRHVDLTEEVRQKIQQCKKVAKKLERLDSKAAQNAQMLQSMHSQMSTDADQSLDNQEESLQINDSSSESNKTGDGTEQSRAIRDYEGDMDDLMDSSMFDELKDKMIESSNLLESLEDDDEDVERLRQQPEVKKSSTASSNNGSSTTQDTEHDHSDGCRCNCHNQSSFNDDGSEKLQLSSMKSTQSTDKDDGSSLGSRVVDMAVQCDILS